MVGIPGRGSKGKSPGSFRENPRGQGVRERYSNSYGKFLNSQSAPKLYIHGSDPEHHFKRGH